MSAPSTMVLHGPPLLRQGKVRDVYDLRDKLLIVASDRISAFDVVMPTPVPGKGKILTQAALFWFEKTRDLVPNHFITADFAKIQEELPKGVTLDPWFEGRVMLVKKAERINAECVARGYLAGSAYNDYMFSGMVCGQPLPSGLQEAEKLPQPIFTPATKAPDGEHDQNITRDDLQQIAGAPNAAELERLTLAIYDRAAEHIAGKGLILADTKFEFGMINGKLHLIDEALTPDSSRVWEASTWKPGQTPESYDKQFLRDWLEKSGWDKNPPGPALPPDVVEGVLRRYRDFVAKVAS